MSKILVGIVVGVLGILVLSPAHADEWLDAVIEFDRPSGSSSEGGPPENALGADNGSYVSVDIPETLTLAFTDNTAMDGPGDDLRIFEVGADSAQADVWGSEDNINYVLLSGVTKVCSGVVALPEVGRGTLQRWMKGVIHVPDSVYPPVDWPGKRRTPKVNPHLS